MNIFILILILTIKINMFYIYIAGSAATDKNMRQSVWFQYICPGTEFTATTSNTKPFSHVLPDYTMKEKFKLHPLSISDPLPSLTSDTARYWNGRTAERAFRLYIYIL